MAERIDTLQGQPAVTQAPRGRGKVPSTQGSIVRDIAGVVKAFHDDDMDRQRNIQRNYLVSLELDSDTKALELTDQFQNNPAGFQQAAQGYIHGLEKNIEEPSLRERIISRFNKAIRPGITKSNENSLDILEEKAAGDLVLKESTDDAILLSGTREIFNERDALQQRVALEWMDTQRTELLATLSEHIVDINGNPQPLFEPTEVAKRLNEFNDKWISNGIEGWESRQESTSMALQDLLDNKGPQMDAIEESRDVPPINIKVRAYDKLSDTAQSTLITKLTKKMGLENAMFAQQQELAKEVDARDRAANDFEELMQVKDLTGTSEETANRMARNIRNGTNTKQGAKDVLKVLTTTPSITDNREIVMQAQVNIASGIDQHDYIVANVAAMRNETFRILLASNKTMLEDSIQSLKTGPESFAKISSNARKGLILIIGGRAPADPSDPFSAMEAMSPERATILNTALDMFDQSVDLENGTIDGKPITVLSAGDLRERIILQAKEIDSEIMPGRRVLIRPRFLHNQNISRGDITVDDMNSAMIQTSVEAVNGRIGRQDYLLEIRELRRWYSQFRSEGFFSDNTDPAIATGKAILTQGKGK